MIRYIFISAAFFILFLFGLFWFKIPNHDNYLNNTIAWGLLASEVLFFYAIIKYYKRKGYKLNSKFPNVINLAGIIIIDYFSKKYYFQNDVGISVSFYNAAFIIFTLLLNISIFFKLKKQ
jgi:hypothetical protein